MMKRYLTFFAVACASTPALAGSIQFFTSHAEFQAFNLQQGKQLKGIETFEESEAPPQSKTPFPNSLQNGVPRPHFPNGIDAHNLIIQSNITDMPCPPTVNPSNSPTALWVNGAGFIGSNSIKIGTDEFLEGRFSSIDLIFTSGDKTGVGVDVSTFAGFNQGHNGFIFAAFDGAGNLLGKHVMVGATMPEPSKNFLGVWSSTPIARLNVWGVFDIPQPFAVDNIEMWVVPEPASVVLFGALGLVGLRRRR